MLLSEAFTATGLLLRWRNGIVVGGRGERGFFIAACAAGDLAYARPLLISSGSGTLEAIGRALGGQWAWCGEVLILGLFDCLGIDFSEPRECEVGGSESPYLNPSRSRIKAQSLKLSPCSMTSVSALECLGGCSFLDLRINPTLGFLYLSMVLQILLLLLVLNLGDRLHGSGM